MRGRSTADRQRGSITLELVIIFPVLLVMLFGTVQVGLWFHHRNIAITAAQEGARVAASYNSTASAGAETARQFATQAGAHNVRVDADSGAILTTVSVTVETPSLMPGLIPDMPITQSATMPLERITR